MDLIGDVDSRGGYVSKILYVETKESGPLRGCALGMPPRSANEQYMRNQNKEQIQSSGKSTTGTANNDTYYRKTNRKVPVDQTAKTTIHAIWQPVKFESLLNGI